MAEERRSAASGDGPRDVMRFRLDEAIEILSRTPAMLTALLEGLGEEWTEADEGPETFSPREVLGHLLHGENVDWMPRLRIILESGTQRPFEPFDRFAHRRLYRERSVAELLTELAEKRRVNLEALAALGLTETDLDRRGAHPGLGEVTLRQLLAAWVVHDLGHIVQIARVMAKSYTDDVGPWTEYMGVLGK